VNRWNPKAKEKIPQTISYFPYYISCRSCSVILCPCEISVCKTISENLPLRSLPLADSHLYSRDSPRFTYKTFENGGRSLVRLHGILSPVGEANHCQDDSLSSTSELSDRSHPLHLKHSFLSSQPRRQNLTQKSATKDDSTQQSLSRASQPSNIAMSALDPTAVFPLCWLCFLECGICSVCVCVCVCVCNYVPFFQKAGPGPPLFSRVLPQPGSFTLTRPPHLPLQDQFLHSEGPQDASLPGQQGQRASETPSASPILPSPSPSLDRRNR
jgi:hypothetical protein